MIIIYAQKHEFIRILSFIGSFVAHMHFWTPSGKQEYYVKSFQFPNMGKRQNLTKNIKNRKFQVSSLEWHPIYLVWMIPYWK